VQFYNRKTFTQIDAIGHAVFDASQAQSLPADERNFANCLALKAHQSFGVGRYAIFKKACGSGGVRVGKLSAHSDKGTKRGWHTDIDRRRLVWKF
jgi:hypothetical protein